MDNHFVKGALGLPQEGEPVEFLIEGREVALIGTYVEHIFRSRYSGYAVERVSSWRSANTEAEAQGTRDSSPANTRGI